MPLERQPITEDDLALWDIAIETPTGENLPEGQGTVAEGEEVYAESCLACHGEEAQGGPDLMYGTMVGGIGTMDESPRVLTPGSMYPYAPILFDYVHRAMPLETRTRRARPGLRRLGLHLPPERPDPGGLREALSRQLTWAEVPSASPPQAAVATCQS